MGNTGSSRERTRSGGEIHINPKDAIVFDYEKPPRIELHDHDEHDDLFDSRPPIYTRPRANTIDPQHCRSSSSHHHGKLLPTMFKWDHGGRDVYISGTFSNWKPIQMAKSQGNFATVVDLPEGNHNYKFFVDGEWMHDPKEETEKNELGTLNNKISVKKTDFDAFEALAIDSITSPHSEKDRQEESQPSVDEPEDWGREMPSFQPWEKPVSPPILPPHLLQVILNKDTPISCEPSLLPEPNHVMLNHLYALSIKDGVMVLSATHRYRKKYVTTLLYKPIAS